MVTEKNSSCVAMNKDSITHNICVCFKQKWIKKQKNKILQLLSISALDMHVLVLMEHYWCCGSFKVVK